MNYEAAREEAISWIHRLDPSVKVFLPKNDTEDMSQEYPTPFSWNGNGRLVASGKGLGIALHEVAHFLLAAPERRQFPEYGLGQDPYRMYRQGAGIPPIRVSRRVADREENLTCYLQVASMRVLGIVNAEEEARKVGVLSDWDPFLQRRDILACRSYRRGALSEDLWERFLKEGVSGNGS